MALKRHLLTLVVIALAVALAAVLTAGSATRAQTSTHYNLEWHVGGGGGQPVSSAHYAVNGTIGQGAASPPSATSLHYALSGGYWYRAQYAQYLPLVLRHGL